MARKNVAVQVVHDDEDEDNEPIQEVSMADALAEEASLAASEPAKSKTRNRWTPHQNYVFYDFVASHTDKETLLYTGTVQDVLDALEPHFPDGIDEARVKSKWNGTIFSQKKSKGQKFPAFPGSTPRGQANEIGDIFAKHGITLPTVAVNTADDDDEEDTGDGE